MATSDKNSAKTEAKGEGISFEYDGETFSVPPAREWDLEVLESYEDGMVAKTVRALLGAEQYDRFKSSGENGKRSVGDLNDLFASIQGALGIEGN